MVNNNIQGAINLVGRGLVNKPRGNFLSGELSKCQNVELVDEQITTRRPLQYCKGTTEATDSGKAFDKPYGFIGYFPPVPGSFAEGVIASYNGSNAIKAQIIAARAGANAWTDTSGATPINIAGFSYNKAVGAFFYNDKYYVIVVQSTFPGNIWKIKLQQGTSYAGALDSAATTVDIVAPGVVPPASVEPLRYRDFFIYKERLWVVTNNGVYFSKATDPMTWTVPDGGFIRYADASSYCAVALKDNIYIGTNNTIQAFTYSTDPNTDGYSREISNQGIRDLEVIQDVVLGIDADQLFEISQTSLSTIVSLTDIYDVVPSKLVLRCAGDNLLLISRGMLAYPSTDPELIDTATLSSELMVFNIKSSFFSKWKFTGKNGTINDFVIADAYFLKDTGNTMFMAVSPSTGKGSHWYMVEDNKLVLDDTANLVPSSFRGLDAYYNIPTTVQKFDVINVDVEVSGWTPDASEYRDKKFRNLLFEGTLPYDNFEVDVVFDNFSPIAVTGLKEYAGAPVSRPPYPYRVGINQRAKSLGVRFKTTNAAAVVPDETKSYFFSLRDLRVLWTYLQGTVGSKGTT